MEYGGRKINEAMIILYKKWSNFLRKKQIVRNEAKKGSLGISHGNNRSFEGRKKNGSCIYLLKVILKSGGFAVTRSVCVV